MKRLDFYIDDDYLHRNKIKFSTGYRILDDFFEGNGLGEGEVIVIGGRPAMGKTSLALNLSLNICKKYSKKILYFSLNEPADDLVSKQLAAEANIPLHKLVRGNKMDRKSLDRVIVSMNEMKKLNINFEDSDDLTIDIIQDICNEYFDSDLGAIFIDDIQSINIRADHSIEESYRIIMKTLKRISVKLGCPVFVLSQLDRRLERQQYKRPQLVNLKGCGEIEYKADVVMLLYRDDYYHPDTREPDVAEIIIAKNRKGEVGMCKLSYFRKTFKVRSL
ncbi:DnaB-like helicase C-terminal domain-containing protein [Halobacteriovorax sp. HLS]|uniref:DnaB-like helicase C-terminal domain-containing protein n=1 Tax=Halobacteriovorax sp. HLS TaxID=2234000 RepID=UPI000FD88D5E|nr:DnaB-like helicase C-terminal domain-containing protein [Halobacteriovorax sp. HLS]